MKIHFNAYNNRIVNLRIYVKINLFKLLCQIPVVVQFFFQLWRNSLISSLSCTSTGFKIRSLYSLIRYIKILQRLLRIYQVQKISFYSIFRYIRVHTKRVLPYLISCMLILFILHVGAEICPMWKPLLPLICKLISYITCRHARLICWHARQLHSDTCNNCSKKPQKNQVSMIDGIYMTLVCKLPFNQMCQHAT